MTNSEWNLVVGEIVAPFGRVGEVKVRLETDFPDRFARCRQLCLRWPDGRSRLVDVEAVRPHKGQILAKIRGVDSIDGAETLRGALVQVRAQDAVPLPANEFYIHDVVGCSVVTPEGRELGAVTALLRGVANDVLVVGSGKDELLLPLVSAVVQGVDVSGRRVVVTPTPGLLGDDQEDDVTPVN